MHALGKNWCPETSFATSSQNEQYRFEYPVRCKLMVARCLCGNTNKEKDRTNRRTDGRTDRQAEDGVGVNAERGKYNAPSMVFFCQSPFCHTLRRAVRWLEAARGADVGVLGV